MSYLHTHARDAAADYLEAVALDGDRASDVRRVEADAAMQFLAVKYGGEFTTYVNHFRGYLATEWPFQPTNPPATCAG